MQGLLIPMATGQCKAVYNPLECRQGIHIRALSILNIYSQLYHYKPSYEIDIISPLSKCVKFPSLQQASRGCFQNSLSVHFFSSVVHSTYFTFPSAFYPNFSRSRWIKKQLSEDPCITQWDSFEILDHEEKQKGNA